MIFFLLGISLFLSIRLEKNNSLAVFLYVSILSIHTLLGRFIPDSEGFTYYLSAALSCFFVMLSLYAIKKVSNLILQLQKLCFTFININLLGWCLYELYYGPIIYRILCFLVYALGIIFIYRDGNNELAINRLRSFFSSIFGVNRKSSRFIRKHKREKG